jgi:PAS domain S-box-containing protein
MTDTNPITKALLSAIRYSTEPMVITDPNLPGHPMIAVNAAFEAMSGYPARETLGRNCRFLQGPETGSETPARIGRCIGERRGCVEWLVNYRRDGSRFWNLLFISPVFARDGTLLHFFGNQRDITRGPPAGLADYTVGKADMPLNGQVEFDALLLGVLEDPLAGGEAASETDVARSRALERIIEAARRLNDVTTRLEPAPWAPPGSAGGT